MDGWWVVYLRDLTDPEDDIWLSGHSSHDDAEDYVEKHAKTFGNYIEDYSIEWEDYYV